MTHIRNNVLDGAAEIAPRGTRNLGSESLARPPLLALAALAAAVHDGGRRVSASYGLSMHAYAMKPVTLSSFSAD